MLTADDLDRHTAAPEGFCWSCGVPDPGTDTCASCGVSTRPRPAPHSGLIGATASVRQRLRTRTGLVVGETPASVLLALPDAGVTEVSRDKLGDLAAASNGSRSSAWTLVSGSRRMTPNDRRKFDDLIKSFVLALVDRSIDETRGFALDALDADCPAWLDKIHLTTSERDFLFASYQADRGNTGVALERLLRLPVDRYPTKDVVFLRCLGAIQADVTAHEGVRQHLQAFPDRPIAQSVLSLLDDGDLSDEVWIRSADFVLERATAAEDLPLPRALAETFVGSLARDEALPQGIEDLGPEARLFALANGMRSGGHTPTVSLLDLRGAPESLVDEAIEHGVLTVGPAERDQSLAKYVLARTDPDLLVHDDLVNLHYETELARRAFLHGDREALDSLPGTTTTAQLKVLDDLRSGDPAHALGAIDAFDGQTRAKVESVARSLEQRSLAATSNEVLTDGTIWPILASLLPEDTLELNSLSAERPALRGIVTWRALSAAVERLWGWDWEGAAVEAKRCLLVARDEHTRDEALNLIACAEWQQGDDADAIAALSSAMEGKYTEGLQVNLGVVAASLDPHLAGEQLGKLALQAPTLALRASAASRALDLWYADPDPWDTAEGKHSLPQELREALRQLVRSDIDEPSFVRFVRTMANWDDAWLGAEGSLADSHYAGTAAATVYQAKARDFEAFVKALAGVVASPEAPEWATEERDGLVGSAIASLNPEDHDPIAASFGLLLIDNSLPMSAGQWVDLVAFTIVAICSGIDPSEGEPKERFVDLVAQARGRILEIDAEQQGRSTEILDFAISAVIRSVAAARAHQYDQVVDVYNDLSSRLRGVPKARINRAAVRSGTQPAVDFLRDTAQTVDRLVPLVPEPEFKGQLAEFRSQVGTLLTAFNRLRGS
jgi:hypothetical protein